MKTTDISDFSYYENSIILNEETLTSKIKFIERMVRSSKEYKDYIKCVRETDDIKGCAFFKDKNLEEVVLEIHHLITLWDLCMMCGLKLIDNLDKEEFLLCSDVAKEVIFLHMKDMIPVVSLTQTIHQLVHNGEYKIPPDTDQLHLGDYKEFIKEYKNYLNKEDTIKFYKYFNIDVENLFK